MGGLRKRQAEYVPQPFRVAFDAAMSKADLMEVAFSLAMRLSEDNTENAANLVADEYRTLAAQSGRKPNRI
jgi:hypothetical protein